MLALAGKACYNYYITNPFTERFLFCSNFRGLTMGVTTVESAIRGDLPFQPATNPYGYPAALNVTIANLPAYTDPGSHDNLFSPYGVLRSVPFKGDAADRIFADGRHTETLGLGARLVALGLAAAQTAITEPDTPRGPFEAAAPPSASPWFTPTKTNPEAASPRNTDPTALGSAALGPTVVPSAPQILAYM